jgi:rod shape-determining protein MreC
MSGRLLGYGNRAPRVVRRRLAVYGILLAISVVLMATSSTAVALELQRGLAFAFAPAQDAVNAIGVEVRSMAGAVAEIDQLRRDNSSLRAENARLAAENLRLGALGPENEQLSTLLQIRGSFQYTMVAARVIGRDVADVSRVVTIDRGTVDSLAVGDVVVGQGGTLVGRITQIGPHAARAVLVNDPSSTVIGEVVSNRATGEVVGALGGQLVMNNVDATQRITIGDEVVTAGITLGSGIRSPYPKNLVIGQVVDVTRDPNAVVQTAYLEPAIDLDRLEVVLVITDYQGGIPDVTNLPTDQVNPDGTLPGAEQPFATPAPSPRRTARPTPASPASPAP